MEHQEWMGSNKSSFPDQMDGFRKQLLIIQFFLSITGILGNVILFASIIRMNHMKTFEIFLFGLATSNLVMLINVEVYDVTLIFYSQSWSLPLKHCSAMRFLKVFGVTASMYFTVLICVFRYQKLRDAGTRGQMPVPLDNILVAGAASWVGMLLAAILAVPTFFIDFDVSTYTGNASCSMDIFHCFQGPCPVAHAIYKYVFLLILNFLPFVIVTGCSCLILRIILHQQKLIHDHELVEDVHHHMHHHHHHHHHHNLHKSTIAILAAMGICQVTWTSYLTLYLAFDSYTFQFWPEAEFYITTLYATISPYVYGIGNNFFSINHCIR
nr:trissin receptor-like [Paramormyrops kingsleyae]